MEYQKFGRGGAGNITSPDESTDASTGDIEAQQNSSAVIAQDLTRPRSEYQHSGRGGAGNYISPEDAAIAMPESVNVTSSPQARTLTESGYSGRGGAGNYRTENTELKAAEERRATQRRERAREEVVRDVEMGLKEPEKAHLGNEKLEYELVRG